MPKIHIIETGEIKEVRDSWIILHRHEKNEKWESFSSYEERTKGKNVADSDLEEIEAYSRLSEGDKESVRKGFKKLVLRKAGWILKENFNKAVDEIHISLPSREEQIKDAKKSAIARAEAKLKILEQFKMLLKSEILEEDLSISFEFEDKEEILSFIDQLSFGTEELLAKNAEIDRLNAKFGKMANKI